MKKIILTAAVLAATTSASAAIYVMPSDYHKSNTYGYVQGLIGWNRTNAVEEASKEVQQKYQFDHPNGGLGIGVDAGINFVPNFGIEAGFLMLMQKTKNVTLNAEISKLYTFYLAPRLSAQLNANLDVYALAGVGYSKIDTKGSPLADDPAITSMSNSALTPMGGVGADWAVTSNVLIGVKYLYISSQLSTPKPFGSKPKLIAQQYIVASLGYKFPM